MEQYNDSNWTGRTPRTLQETRFGPYATWSAYNKDTRKKAQKRAVAGRLGWYLGLPIAFGLLLNVDRVAYYLWGLF